MKEIALFFPAIISVCIYCKRQSIKLEFNLHLLVRYGVYTIFTNLCGMSLITYIIGIEATAFSLESFGFFTKYTFITVFFALCFPYIEEIVKKYLFVSFQVAAKRGVADESVENV